MSLYKRCLQLASATQSDADIEKICYSPHPKQLTLPGELPSELVYTRSLVHCVYYISDIHLVHKVTNHFKEKATDEQVKSYVKKIAKNLIQKTCFGNYIILFGGDISSCFELSKIFYTTFIKQLEKNEKNSYFFSKAYIYAILGNHEFWDFETMDSCYAAYRELFETLGIHFLQNTITWFGEHITPMKEIESTEGQPQYVELKKDENEAEFEQQKRYIHNTMIVGGVGFAGYNNQFNANIGIYNKALTREQELEETYHWEETYHRALALAKENNCVLIVLSHTPISDWKKDGIGNGGCVYFNGHTHHDYLYHDEARNIHIFANNQIGYKNPNVQFKEAYLYNRSNPFADYEDGYHMISGTEYLRFYDYMLERIRGIGHIERQIKNNNAQFYVIKHSEYYGFFLISSKGTYICMGGRIKKISECCDINKFDVLFIRMVNQYLKLLAPYRNAQEQIAQAVKAFGGDGIIHSCIIDIDFFNHIMLDPSDGSVTYYYSPSFGLIEKYENLMALLDSHNKKLAKKYRKQLKSREHGLIFRNQTDTTSEMIQIDIKNSIYSFSNRLNQLQRLFEKKILRDWNDSLLLNTVSDKRLTLFDEGSTIS